MDSIHKRLGPVLLLSSIQSCEAYCQGGCGLSSMWYVWVIILIFLAACGGAVGAYRRRRLAQARQMQQFIIFNPQTGEQQYPPNYIPPAGAPPAGGVMNPGFYPSAPPNGQMPTTYSTPSAPGAPGDNNLNYPGYPPVNYAHGAEPAKPPPYSEKPTEPPPSYDQVTSNP